MKYKTIRRAFEKKIQYECNKLFCFNLISVYFNHSPQNFKNCIGCETKTAQTVNPQPI